MPYILVANAFGKTNGSYVRVGDCNGYPKFRQLTLGRFTFFVFFAKPLVEDFLQLSKCGRTYPVASLVSCPLCNVYKGYMMVYAPLRERGMNMSRPCGFICLGGLGDLNAWC